MAYLVIVLGSLVDKHGLPVRSKKKAEKYPTKKIADAVALALGGAVIELKETKRNMRRNNN